MFANLHLVDPMLSVKYQKIHLPAYVYLILSVLHQIVDLSVSAIASVRVIKLVWTKNVKILVLVHVERMHNVVLSVTRLCAIAKPVILVIHSCNALLSPVSFLNLLEIFINIIRLLQKNIKYIFKIKSSSIKCYYFNQNIIFKKF